ncbi:MAG: hypothetical protein DRP00_05345 [Candidatus Aenigmatarchaeota archaeon]|nr:MAG: hypothetical protein DRP00_05345 [Candidatus Aenigmarchaeota archaeon]
MEGEKMKVKIVEIDLSKLYDVLKPLNFASDTLLAILDDNYCDKEDIVLVVNYSPDSERFCEIVRNKTKLEDYEIENFLEKKSRELESAEEAEKELAERINANLIVNLYEGYESATAFISTK